MTTMEHTLKKIYRIQTNHGPRYYVHLVDTPSMSFWVDDSVELLNAALHDSEVVIECVDDHTKVDLNRPLSPVRPSKIICIGLNYAHHAKEMNKQVPDEPLMFLKPPTALLAPHGTIERPAQSDVVHHEAELALVIGKRAKDVSKEDAMSYLLGYTCANDVTARDIQRKEKRYTRGKGFDTFCPVGPCIVLKEDYDPSTQRIICRVNGDVRQDAQMNDLIFSIEHIISFVSHVMTLMPGDIILTGTPMGVGALEHGDDVEVEATGLGVLHNVVGRR